MERSTPLQDTGDGTENVTLAHGTSAGGLTLRTGGRTDVVARRVTIEPGGTTGWHYHPGQALVIVRAGTLTRVLHDGSVETNPAGQAFVEEGGPAHVHIGHNLGGEPVVLHVTYLVPAGGPLSVAAVAPALRR
ncbi:cupin domain-containing protein [Streptomyces sp. NPDC092296]|uniref:cupin domain-containing protein n=1 Tax=Streptomyces sp. NPDC092296 TaxID=3366012 RepID=UPI0037F6F3DB